MRTLLLLLLPIVAFSGVYKSIDKQGNVIFSDMPVQGSKPFRLDVLQPANPSRESDANQRALEPKKQISIYTNFQISNPDNNATLRDNNGDMIVGISVEPMLRKGDTIQLFLDKTKIGNPENTTFFSLKNIDRGTHTLEATLLIQGSSNNLKTNPVTFHMHRARLTPAGIRSMLNTQTAEVQPLQVVAALVGDVVAQALTGTNPMETVTPSNSMLPVGAVPTQQLTGPNPMQSVAPAMAELNTAPLESVGQQLTPVETRQDTVTIKQGETPNNQQQGGLPGNAQYQPLIQGQTPNGIKQGSIPKPLSTINGPANISVPTASINAPANVKPAS